ncbi:CpaD family pilus assembly lipoprotein (plasmid) [Bradyrhizobium sp. 62B]|uniref:CpaD family pilus assembly lipoprotein n=1 Tax=Bradyrhizobium sp. 62B TaxID=2898442 RepID=UPI0025580E81|nr:CpaD family pilus assembly lipoprotein [Bradyrhizobium sp. 62B]
MTLRNLGHLIAVAAILSGCTHGVAMYSKPTEDAIQVEQKISVLRLQSFRRAERHDLRTFIANGSHGRRDALHLDVSGLPWLVAQVAHEARAIGVPAYNIRLSAPPVDPPGHFSVQVKAITYEARPPLCPFLSVLGPSVDDNSFNPTLGCSVRSNLAIMVNDAGDLLENNAILPTTGDRAALPLSPGGSLMAGSKSHLGGATHNNGSSDTQ